MKILIKRTENSKCFLEREEFIQNRMQYKINGNLFLMLRCILFTVTFRLHWDNVEKKRCDMKIIWDKVVEFEKNTLILHFKEYN